MPGDVFKEYPFEAIAELAGASGNFWPQMSLVILAPALSSSAEGLAGVSGKNGIEGAVEGPGVEAAQVGPDRGRGEVAHALGCDEDRPWPVLPFDEGAGVIAGLGEHEAQIKASAACAEGQSVPGT